MFAILFIPCRFLVVHAVVNHEKIPSPQENQAKDITGGVYDGVLMKMSDLAYANLDSYQNDTLQALDTLSAEKKGPSGIYHQVAYVNKHDWHVSYSDANRYFFSDLNNWRIIAIDDLHNKNGFYAIAFQKGNTVVVAFRGTDDAADLVNDAGIYLDMPDWINQLKPAKNFVEQVRTSLPKGQYNVVFTGHSLGAWLSQRMYLAYHAKYTDWHVLGATVFDSIGTHFHKQVADVADVKDYRYQGDVFSHYGSSLGQEIRIPNPMPDQSVYDKHQMYDFYAYFYPKTRLMKSVDANSQETRKSM